MHGDSDGTWNQNKIIIFGSKAVFGVCVLKPVWGRCTSHTARCSHCIWHKYKGNNHMDEPPPPSDGIENIDFGPESRFNASPRTHARTQLTHTHTNFHPFEPAMVRSRVVFFSNKNGHPNYNQILIRSKPNVRIVCFLAFEANSNRVDDILICRKLFGKTFGTHACREREATQIHKKSIIKVKLLTSENSYNLFTKFQVCFLFLFAALLSGRVFNWFGFFLFFSFLRSACLSLCPSHLLSCTHTI